jgi:predicted heme/steroid binding protein
MDQIYVLGAVSMIAGLVALGYCRRTKPKMGDMSLEELAAIHRTDGRLLIGCKAKIYDVSSNEMYAPGAGYNCFVGKDASVALGKMKFNPEFLDPKQMHWSKDLD